MCPSPMHAVVQAKFCNMKDTQKNIKIRRRHLTYLYLNLMYGYALTYYVNLHRYPIRSMSVRTVTMYFKNSKDRFSACLLLLLAIVALSLQSGSSTIPIPFPITK